MKRFVLPLPFVFLIAVCQPVEKLVDTAATNITSNGVHRYRRALKPAPTSCSVNQYFDKQEGRCLGSVGGGKVLYINDTVSCDTNTLKPHCTNPRYYYICKKDKIILAQCTRGRHFENRLQKCVHVSRDAYETATVNPKTETFDSFEPPECKTLGSFPFPSDCAQFYVCETNGHRMHQNFFRCPENTAYDRETEMCVPSDNCKGAKNLPSMCTWSIHKEKLTIEEAERWLNIWPLNETRFADTLVNVSKNFTLNENGSVTICETIFVPGSNATNVYETRTRSSSDVAITSVSYVESTTSAFAEVSDKSDVTTSTRRDVEMSRPSNAIEAYPGKTEPEFARDDESPLETSAEPSLKEKVTEVPTISTDKSTASNTGKETEVNKPLSDVATSAEPVLKDQHSTTEKVAESSSTVVANIHDDSTILPKRELDSSTEMDKHNSETSTNGPTTFKEPVSEDRHRTVAPENSVDPQSPIHNDPMVSNESKLPSITEREVEANTSTNGPSSEIGTLKGPVSEDQHRTVAPEKSVDPQSPIHNDPMVSNDHQLPSTTEREMEANTSTNGPSLEISTLKGPVSEDQQKTVAPENSVDPQSHIHDDPMVSNDHQLPSITEREMEANTSTKGPVSEDQHSTVAPEKSVHTDPTVSNESEQPSTTERELEANTEANINEPLLDTTTLAQQYSTTEKLIESSSTVANVQDDSTVLPKRELSSSTETDMHNIETSTNGPTLEMATTKPVSEDQYSTTERVTQSSSTEAANIHDDSTVLPKRELSSSTEMDERNSETSTNGPTMFKIPISEDQYSTVASEKSVHTDPTVSNEPKLPSTTEKEMEANTEASINESSLDVATSAEPVLKDQHSTTEKVIESSTVANVQDDSTNLPKRELSSSTETSAQNLAVPTESVSNNHNAAYVDRTTASSTPKSVHEFHEALTSTKATFVVDDASSTTVSPNTKTANETLIDNAVPTSNVAASEASESTTMKPITSPEELLANCMALSSANGSLTSTQPDSTNAEKSSNSAETRSRSSDGQQNSRVTDNDGTKENVARKGINAAPETEYHGKTISKHVVLPIASAVLNITDKYERRLKYSLRNFLSRHALEHKKYA